MAQFTFEARKASERRACGMRARGKVIMAGTRTSQVGHFKIQLRARALIWLVKVLRRKRAKGQGDNGVEKQKKTSRGSVQGKVEVGKAVRAVVSLTHWRGGRRTHFWTSLNSCQIKRESRKPSVPGLRDRGRESKDGTEVPVSSFPRCVYLRKPSSPSSHSAWCQSDMALSRWGIRLVEEGRTSSGVILREPPDIYWASHRDNKVYCSLRSPVVWARRIQSVGSRDARDTMQNQPYLADTNAADIRDHVK